MAKKIVFDKAEIRRMLRTGPKTVSSRGKAAIPSQRIIGAPSADVLGAFADAEDIVVGAAQQSMATAMKAASGSRTAGGAGVVGDDILAVFDYTDATGQVLDFMRAHEKPSRARRMVRDAAVPFLNTAAMLSILQTRAALGEDIGAQLPSLGVRGKATTLLSKGLRVLPLKGPTLSDTGAMARVFSARWRGGGIGPRFGRALLEFGPFGETDLTRPWGIPFTDPDEHPKRFWAGADAVSSNSKSNLTYSQLAWAHELGYTFKVTAPMVGLFGRLAGLVGDQGADPIYGDDAAKLYFGWTKPVKQADGIVRRVPKQHLVTVAPRPWMQSGIRSAQITAKTMAPNMAASVFSRWTQFAAGAKVRARGAGAQGLAMFVGKEIGLPEGGLLGRGELRLGVSGAIGKTIREGI